VRALPGYVELRMRSVRGTLLAEFSLSEPEAVEELVRLVEAALLGEPWVSFGSCDVVVFAPMDGPSTEDELWTLVLHGPDSYREHDLDRADTEGLAAGLRAAARQAFPQAGDRRSATAGLLEDPG